MPPPPPAEPEAAEPVSPFAQGFAAVLQAPHGFLGIRPPGLLQRVRVRWCVLVAHALLWFDAPQEPPLRVERAVDGVRLADIVAIREGKPDKQGRPTFVLATVHGPVAAVAPSAAAHAAWLAVLRAHAFAVQPDPAAAALLLELRLAGVLTVRDPARPWVPAARCWAELRGPALALYDRQPDAAGAPAPRQVLALTFRAAVAPPRSPHSFSFKVYTRDAALLFEAGSRVECDLWLRELLAALDRCPAVTTPYERFVEEVLATPPDGRAAVYAKHAAVAHCVYYVLKEPLLPLSYGEVSEGAFYDTYVAEALRVSFSLAPGQEPGRYGMVRTPHTLCDLLMGLAQDVWLLRNEVYLQLVKLTTSPPEPGSVTHLTHWAVLMVLCSTVPPVGKAARFLFAHFAHTRRQPRTARPCPVRYAADFCEKALTELNGCEKNMTLDDIIALLTDFNAVIEKRLDPAAGDDADSVRTDAGGSELLLAAAAAAVADNDDDHPPISSTRSSLEHINPGPLLLRIGLEAAVSSVSDVPPNSAPPTTLEEKEEEEEEEENAEAIARLSLEKQIATPTFPETGVAGGSNARSLPSESAGRHVSEYSVGAEEAALDKELPSETASNPLSDGATAAAAALDITSSGAPDALEEPRREEESSGGETEASQTMSHRFDPAEATDTTSIVLDAEHTGVRNEFRPPEESTAGSISLLSSSEVASRDSSVAAVDLSSGVLGTKEETDAAAPSSVATEVAGQVAAASQSETPAVDTEKRDSIDYDLLPLGFSQPSSAAPSRPLSPDGSLGVPAAVTSLSS